MGKTLVTYFTASTGKVTKRVAKTLADSIGADLFEIKPVELYTEADINWMNPLSRCNKEKMGKKDCALRNLRRQWNWKKCRKVKSLCI